MHTRTFNPWPFVLAVGVLAAKPALAVPLEDAIRAAVAERLAADPGDVVISEVSADPAVPDDAAWTIRLPDYRFGNGHVAVQAEAGAHRLRLNPKVTLYGLLPVVDAEIPQGAVVTYTLERRPLADLRGGAPIDPALTWDATVPLHRGRVLTSGIVRRHPDLREGTEVQLVAIRGGLVVTAPGQLLDDALLGTPVSVLNLATKAELRGTLREDGRIHLGGP